MSAILLNPRTVQFFIGIAHLVAVTSVWAVPSDLLAEFDRIYIKGNVQIELTPFVTASGDSVAVQHVHTEVVDAVLYVDAEHVLTTSQLSLKIGVNEVK